MADPVAQPPARPPVWEQRWHPFREEWVLYTSHRGRRPWVGERKSVARPKVACHDPTCALCPRNERLGGRRNPDYRGVFVFENDLPCFGGPNPPAAGMLDPLRRVRAATGTAEVICYHPDHGRTMAEFTVEETESVVGAWTARTHDLSRRPDVEHVLVFENKGEVVGTSNPHPHGQIYAGNLVYGHAARELAAARRYRAEHGRALGPDVAAREAEGPRVLARRGDWIACVPWFALYAYEVHLLPLVPAARLTDLDDRQRADLAWLLRDTCARYDALWSQPMPYVLALHQAPTAVRDPADYPFHLEFHPPLRRPDTMKYLAGPEVGGGSMTNESDPDERAAELRAALPSDSDAR